MDLSLLFSYLFSNPFKISKKFLIKKGEKDIYAYGETPLTTLDYISTECHISANDKVFELGCGRGRTCLWLNQFIGCSVVGIDYIPEFIRRANQVKERYSLSNVEFRKEDILQANLQGATIIYLYGTCYSTSFIKALIKRFQDLPQGTKFITVSYALSDYVSLPIFEIRKCFPAKFTWGTADVYLQIKR